MKRGTKPLRTLTALSRTVGLAHVGRKRAAAADAAGKPVKPSLTTRRQPAVPDDVRTALLLRSEGLCEMALPGCAGLAVDPSHRISVKAGGRKGEAKQRHDRLSNLLHACRACHDWCHARDRESKDLGLRLAEHHDPAQEPAVRRGQLVYLTDDGRVLDFEEVGC